MQQPSHRHPRFRVLVLGYGEMGHAFERLLDGRHELRIWQRRPQPPAVPLDLAAEGRAADFVIFCLPAGAHAEIAVPLAAALRPGTICLSIAKGVDDRGRTAAQVLAESLGAGPAHAVLYGPMISEEIRAGRPAFADCGCGSVEVYERVRALFAGASLALRHTTDVTGISWSAVLKNVYAMLFGAADELRLGDNMRGYLVAAALGEMDRIVSALGGERGTPFGLAGLADLVTTATSAGSHHHELGRRLVRGEDQGLAGEGLHTLATLRRRRLFDPDAHPLFALISRIVERPAQARGSVMDYLQALEDGAVPEGRSL